MTAKQKRWPAQVSASAHYSIKGINGLCCDAHGPAPNTSYAVEHTALAHAGSATLGEDLAVDFRLGG